MRVYVRREIAGGGSVPTATEVTAAVGGTVSLALQVLAEFPQHHAAQRTHETPSLRALRGVSADAGLASTRPAEDARLAR